MRITIDASCLLLNRYSGLSEVAHNLLLHLPFLDQDNQFTLLINYFRGPMVAGDINYPHTNSIFWRLPRRLVSFWWRIGGPPIDFFLDRTDIYHSLHIQIPPTKRTKNILTVHDCRYLALPNHYRYREIEHYRNQMKKSLERVEMVAAVSEFTRQELLSYFSFPEDRVRVIHNGFTPFRRDDEYYRAKASLFIEENNLPQSYLLYIGVLDPRKNLNRLIEAIAQSRGQTKGYPELLIAGISLGDWLKSEQRIKAKDLGLLDHIHLTGGVEKDILVGLIQRAHVLCYPSLYEGFGFPPLEAMSLGVPVLAGRSSAIPEVTGHAACLVDPSRVDDIAHGLDKIIFDADYRQSLTESGYIQVKKFSWRKAAAEYIELYKEVLS